MVDTVDTRQTMYDRRRTMPGLRHKLTTVELKTGGRLTSCTSHILCQFNEAVNPKKLKMDQSHLMTQTCLQNTK